MNKIITQEDKELLLKDLCARLPYGVKVFYEYVDDLNKETYGYSLTLNTWCINELEAEKAVVKPYLRPLSSMTEKEKNEIGRISCDGNIEHKYGIFYRSQDYLNSIHVDYRGLIERGLAIEVTEENNPYEN